MSKVESSINNKKGDNVSYGETIMIEKYDAMLERMDTILEFMLQEKSGENVNKEDGVK